MLQGKHLKEDKISCDVGAIINESFVHASRCIPEELEENKVFVTLKLIP